MKLWQHINEGDMPAVHEYVTDNILPMLEKDGRILLANRRSTSDEIQVSVDILRAIWKYLWTHSTKTNTLPPEYQGLYTGHFIDAVRSVYGPAVSDTEVKSNANSAMLIFANPANRIAQVVGGDRSGSEWGVKQFDARFPIDLSRTNRRHVKYDWRDERREEEETAKPENQKVVSTFSLPQIPPPPVTSDPEEWGTWGKRVFGVVASQHRRMVALQNEVDKLTEALEAATSAQVDNAFKQVADDLVAEWEKIQEGAS